jgi:hypothetical protein
MSPYPYDQEEGAEAAIRSAVRALAPHVEDCWHVGDGHGGWVLDVIVDEFDKCGLLKDRHVPTPQRKAIPVMVRAEVLARGGMCCAHCGSTDDLTIDHVVPVAKGGLDDPGNLQVLCRRCNSSKRDR